jgi:hypothetical protein
MSRRCCQQLRGEDVRELQSGAALPEKVLTANAYLGAVPVKRALDEGAQIVITGRCVDSAVTLGALMHEFGWATDDYDRLAQASLAGHIIECGCQATGGLHTDWQAVPDWPNIGYPILECHADGHFVVGKPPGTGGLVNCAVIAEQMLYEIGDPARYLLPDVVLRLHPGARSRKWESTACVCGRARQRAGAGLQGVGHLHGRLSLHRATHHGGRGRRGQGAPHRRGHPGPHAWLFTQAGLPTTAARTSKCWAARRATLARTPQTMHVREAVLHLAVMHPRESSTGNLCARDRACGHQLVSRHHRRGRAAQCRRPASSSLPSCWTRRGFSLWWIWTGCCTRWTYRRQPCVPLRLSPPKAPRLRDSA